MNAGDIMVAQQSGIVCIPCENAHEILERLTIKEERNREFISNVKKGVFLNKWVDDALKAENCQFADYQEAMNAFPAEYLLSMGRLYHVEPILCITCREKS